MDQDTFLAANHSLFGSSNEACMDLELLLAQPPSPGGSPPSLSSPPLSPLSSLLFLPSSDVSAEAPQANDKPQQAPSQGPPDAVHAAHTLSPLTHIPQQHTTQPTHAHPAAALHSGLQLHSHTQQPAGFTHDAARVGLSAPSARTEQHAGQKRHSPEQPAGGKGQSAEQPAGQKGRSPMAGQPRHRATDSSSSLTCALGVGEGGGAGALGHTPSSLLDEDSDSPPPPSGAQQRPKKKKIRDEAARSRRKAARKRQSMHDMEDYLVRKTEELKILERENEELKYQEGILDSVICTRSHQLGMIQPTDAPPRGVVVTSGRDLTPQATCKKGKAEGGEEPRAEGWESRIPRYPAGTTLHSHSLNLFAAKPGTHIDPSYCQQITPGLFKEVYKEHIFALSEHLRIQDAAQHQQPLQHGDAPLPAAEKGIINEACCLAHLYKFSSVHQPDLVACQMARHLETGEEGVPDASHWRLLLQQLVLSPQQVSDLLGASQLYQKLMRNVLSERTRLQAALREYEAAIIHAHSHDSCCGPQTLGVPVSEELLEKLLKNLRQERSLGWMLQGFLISHVCTVLQTAKVFAYSYPYIPDARPIVSTLWNDLEAQNALPAKFRRPV